MNKPEFSKLVLGAVMLLFFAGAAFGAYIVTCDTSGLGVLLSYIGAPTVTAIGFYAWKAKNENVLKVAKALEKEIEKDSKKGKKTTPEAKAKLVKAVAEVLGAIETEGTDNEQ